MKIRINSAETGKITLSLIDFFKACDKIGIYGPLSVMIQKAARELRGSVSIVKARS